METQLNGGHHTAEVVIDQQVHTIQKVLYTAETHVTGGRDGFARSSDNRLQARLSSPGSKLEGTNPEQLFAAGWSACFIGAMQLNAAGQGLVLPEGVAVDAEVDLCSASTGFFFTGPDKSMLTGARYRGRAALVNAAHQSCPYSRATSGNINVSISIVV